MTPAAQFRCERRSNWRSSSRNGSKRMSMVLCLLVLFTSLTEPFCTRSNASATGNLFPRHSSLVRRQQVLEPTQQAVRRSVRRQQARELESDAPVAEGPELGGQVDCVGSFEDPCVEAA